MNIIPLGIWGGYPKANSATSSFLIEHEGFHCLFDCGSGVLSSLQNYIELDQLDAVVISHYHADHIADIGSLQYSRLIQYYLDNLPLHCRFTDMRRTRNNLRSCRIKSKHEVSKFKKTNPFESARSLLRFVQPSILSTVSQ